MIICPLNMVECTIPITPKPRTAFVMAPSTEYQTDTSTKVLNNILEGLSNLNYKFIEGSKLVRHGDYSCSICNTIQGCALGVALVYDGLSIKTVGNIYLETGIMQGFGKPVILFVDKKENLASDYIRSYVISYSSDDYLSTYRSLLEDIGKLPENMYEYLGKTAYRVEDYEKATKYYQEAYLINPKQETKLALGAIVRALKKDVGIPIAYKKRLLDNIEFFYSKI